MASSIDLNAVVDEVCPCMDMKLWKPKHLDMEKTFVGLPTVYGKFIIIATVVGHIVW